MGEPVIDRRTDARFPSSGATAARATLRPGCPVAVVNVSASGVLVQAARPLRPGARVHLQVVTTVRTFTLAAHVVRCAVWAIDDGQGATYRGALRFEHRAESVRESLAPPPLRGPQSR